MSARKVEATQGFEVYFNKFGRIVIRQVSDYPYDDDEVPFVTIETSHLPTLMKYLREMRAEAKYWQPDPADSPAAAAPAVKPAARATAPGKAATGAQPGHPPSANGSSART